MVVFAECETGSVYQASKERPRKNAAALARDYCRASNLKLFPGLLGLVPVLDAFILDSV